MSSPFRVYLSVADSMRRASLAQALRMDASVRFVSREEDADVVVKDSEATHSSSLSGDAGDSAAPVKPGQSLTPREREVLLLVAAGMGNARIGEQLGISKSTVKYHLGAIFTKLGVHTRAEAVTRGIRSGLVLL
ncbi:MAG: response regulator transcription factor [bacterium]